MKSPGFRASPVVFLAALTVLAWGLFALAAAVLGEIHVLALAAAVLTTAVLVAWPMIDGSSKTAGPGLLMMTVCRDCGRSVRPAEGFGFCIRCGSVRFANTSVFRTA